ncbi:hypothetical protein SLA2020_305580 [Shorea laevis]
METWQIIHIPDKPQVPPDQQPTVNVYAAVIELKLANSLVRRLNQIAPLENLHHVKRVQKKCLEGKTQLSVILCLACENETESNSIPQDVQELINSYQLSSYITKVSKYAPLSKEEWEEQCKLWPTSYHPPTYNIDGITGFSKEDAEFVFGFMKYTIELVKSSDSSIVNAAVIVDPSAKQIIASACDQVSMWCNPPSETSIERSNFKQSEVVTLHADSNGVARDVTLSSNGLSINQQSFATISCLNPWEWPQQLLNTSSCYWHPLRHAAIVAIEASAARDRHLFPGLGNNGDKAYEFDNDHSSPVKNDEEPGALSEGSQSSSARPYLCTGYDIYLVWEPCTMCAMALVHQRIKRIFYSFPNPKAGALGSVHRLQGEKSLNHHYAVFRVLIPEEVLKSSETLPETKSCQSNKGVEAPISM